MIEKIKNEIADLKKKFQYLADSFSSDEEIKLSFIEFCDESFGVVVNVGNYYIYIQQKFYHEIWICIRHIIKLRNNEIPSIFPIFPKADDLYPLIWEKLRFVKGSYVFDSSFDTLYNDIEKIVSNIRKNYSALIPILDSSTLRFPDGTMKRKRNSWKSHAIIIDISQESRYGVESDFEERYYVLRIKILHPSQEDYELFTYKIEIEDFIRKYLLPKFKRDRMSTKLEDEINKKLAKQQVVVITHDFDEDGTVSVDATYLPVGFKSWYEYLRSLF